ncbi:4Fe-4S binding protein [candidate division WOR-3 bacterium]|nr:4Fe-4S binding protein [candidate division WOR-3 bacterium]
MSHNSIHDMGDDVFDTLADALNRLPNGFPRTPSNVEILILKKIFSKREAELASKLTGTPEPVGEIASCLGIAESDLKPRLVAMAKRGLLWMWRKDAKLMFRLAPFIVGIYEAALEKMDHEFAHLFEEYMENGGAAGIMKPQPALHRVVPAHGSVKSEWILPYDDIRVMLEKAKSFRARDCICRVQQDKLDSRKCDFPVRNCVTFSPFERASHPNDITKEEAVALLDEAEEVGLVHCVSNVIQDIFYVCNCCGCCCGVLRGITELGIEESVARANYYAQINTGECTGCGVCVERCQVRAIILKEDVAAVARDKCIGCGLCVSGCSVKAVSLERKSDAEMVHPPDDFSTWEKMRLEYRGLTDKK